MDGKMKMILLIAIVAGLLLGVFTTRLFAGDSRALRATVTSYGAPPMLSHQDWKEESCARCHDAENRPESNVPITPHPERTVCRQCHLPNEDPGAPLFVENSYCK